ncbi:hypothetical protein A4A49_40385 [Nicotiana attenuata]|uniref:Uncharacterized protein n=1 Tax=Nicotiana attenuata TaxID=49451 RepID=A0A1J6JT47_NICAT|nr:hypothetical protein A4A49_40385 [Nicotiana attenuata]
MGKPEELPPARLDHQKEPQVGNLNLQQPNVAESSYAKKLSSLKPQTKPLSIMDATDVKARITTHNGTVKIGAYDRRTVFIDFCDEQDCKNFYFRRALEINGFQMWLDMWTLDFRPDHDSHIVPVWVLLPELPFHCHTWHYVKQILEPVEKSLTMDVATFGRTRPSTTKVRVEIDLTKPQVTIVYVGQEEEMNSLKGFTQKIEYEHVPKYCKYCKLIGHSLVQCRAAIKKKSVVETEDKIEAEQTQASEQSEEEMEQTSNMISEKKVNQPDNNTQDKLNTKKMKERVKRKQRRQRTAISKKIKKRKNQVNEHLQHQVEDMTLLSRTEDRKSNDNIDKPIWNYVQQQSDEKVGQASGADATKVLTDEVNPELGSIINKDKLIKGTNNPGTNAQGSQTKRLMITCQESNYHQIVCNPKGLSINIHNSFQILEEEQEE